MIDLTISFHYLDCLKDSEVVQKSSVLQNKTQFDRSYYDNYYCYFTFQN